MKPVIAIVGRPNVGKSTLFNQLTKSRDAIVADFSGLTRDRKYGEGRVGDKAFICIDTAGIGQEVEEGVDELMSHQSWRAIRESDVVLLLVDGRAGLQSDDDFIARRLRNAGKKVFLVVNKTDGVDPEVARGEFFRLGFEEVHAIAAVHGRGVAQLIAHVLADIPEQPPESLLPVDDDSILIAIVGRPNVGKSTLVNRLLGEERVVVSEIAGTTRDSIYIPYQRDERKYTLIDTAGMRRRGRVDEAVEKFSVVKTLQSIDDAQVAILVVDAHEGLVEQDLHLLGYVLEQGRALVIAINKWDNLDTYQKDQVRKEMDRRLGFAEFAKTHFISALHGSGVGDLYPSIDAAYAAARARLSTAKLTEILEGAVQQHQPPMVRGRRPKLRYAHMGGTLPPVIVIHGNSVDDIPEAYRRFLENMFRKAMRLEGSPLRIEFKGGENPFAGKKNTLTARQVAKKRRLIRHIKKQKRRD
ncbi:MAG: ribosome biogenesis GTPase Der [Pseudomonadota bacterium]